MSRTMAALSAFGLSAASGLMVLSPVHGKAEAVGSVTGDRWTVPAQIGTSSWSMGSETSVVTDPQGDVTVLWTKARGMVSRTRQFGHRWGPVRELHGWGPAILGSDAAGNVTATWGKFLPGLRTVLMAATKPDSGRWGVPRRISPIPTKRGCRVGPEKTALAVSPNGAAVAAWEWTSGDCRFPDREQVSYRPPGGTWHPPVSLARDASVEDVAVTPRGFPMVLLRSHTSTTSLWVMQRTSQGWRRAGGVIARQVGDADMAIGPTGRTVVVATQQVLTPAGETDYRIIGARWATGRWTAPVALSRPGDEYRPSVGVDARGTAAVAWSFGDNEGLRVARWTVGHPPARPRTLADRNAWDTIVQVAPSGATTVIWTRWPNRAPIRLVTSSRTAQGDWTTPRVISGQRGVAESSAALGVMSHGRAVASWIDAGMRPNLGVRVSWSPEGRR
jgi:hypothetical protein